MPSRLTMNSLPDRQGMTVEGGKSDVRRSRPTSRMSPVVTVEAFDEQGAVIVVDGDLDVETVPQLEAALSETIASGHLHLVVDLTAATFLDSMAMGTLLRSIHPLRDAPTAAVALAGAHGIVERSLTISGIGEMFSAFDSRDDAVRRVTGRTGPLRDQWRRVRPAPYPSAP